MAASAIATASRLLKAGAVLPAGTPCAPDLPFDRLDARSYRSPLLGHPVVRLVAPAVAPGEDLVMEYLGFGAAEVEAEVGQALRRAPGFPGWALINDPKHARHALDVVKQMKTVARRIRSKPGHAWDGFVAIAERLGRSTAHFLPSFWEEAGRMFIACGNLTYATRSFGRAREAEKIHALKVELQALRDSFLEFALHGAVSVKALGEFARQLSVQHSPSVAWEALRDLAVRRCQGGLPPWATMLAELRALAAAAKLDRDAELRRLVAELLPLSAVRRASSSFWETASEALGALARDPAWMGTLLDLLPTPSDKGTAFAFWWLERLEGWGLLRHLEAGKLPDGAALDVASWVERFEQHTGDSWWRDPSPDLWFTVFERLAPRLVGGRPLQLVGRESNKADVDLIHLALELGVPLADPPGRNPPGFSLDRWARFATSHPRRHRDPARVHADPRFAKGVAEAAADALGHEEFDRLLPGMPTLLAAAIAWAERQLDSAERGALPAVVDLLSEFEEHVKPAFLAAAPAVAARLAAFDPAPCLARTLRIGLIDELGWPALEQAVERLGGEARKRRNDNEQVMVRGEAPFAVVWNALRAEVIGPTGLVLKHDFSLPTDAQVDGCWYRDGQLLVGIRRSWNERWFYWSSTPKEQIPHTRYLSHDFEGVQVTLPQGGTSTGYRAQRAGEREPDLRQRKLVGDGRTWWVLHHDESAGPGQQTLHEIDLATGDIGRASMPAWFEEAVGPGRVLDLQSSHLLPLGAHVDGSCLGGRSGLSGLRVVRIEGRDETVVDSIDDRHVTLKGMPVGVTALVRWPGGGDRPISGGDGRYNTIEVWSPEGVQGSDAEQAPGQVCALPLLCWHAMQPRDPAASARLRAVDDGLARELLDQACSEVADRASGDDEEDEDDDVDGQQDRVAAMPGSVALLRERLRVAHPRLQLGLLGLLAHAAELNAQLKVRSGGDGAGVAVDDGFEKLVVQGCGLLGFSIGGPEQVGVAQALAMQGAFLRSADAPPPKILVKWWMGLQAIRPLCGNGLLSDVRERRSALAAVLRAWVDAGLADLPGRWRAGVVGWEPGSPPIPLRKISYREWFGTAREGSNVFMVLRTYDDGKGVVFEYAPGGTFVGMAKAPFIALHDFPPVPWPVPRLRAVIAALEDGAPPALDAALLDRAVAALGATRAETALLLLGVDRYPGHDNNFLPKELRERLDLKVAEAVAARERLRELPLEQRDALAQALIGDDPAGVAALEKPGADGSTPLARLATAWRALAQAAMEFDPGEETRRILGNSELRELTALAAKASAGAAVLSEGFPEFRLGMSAHHQDVASIDLVVEGERGVDALDTGLLAQICHLAAGFQLHQPAGLAGPVALSKLVAQVRRRVADRRVVLHLYGTVMSTEENAKKLVPLYERAWESARGAKETVLTAPANPGLTATLRDAGLLLLVRLNGDLYSYFRPALIDGPAALATLRQLLDETGEAMDSHLPALRRWFDPATQRLLDRLAEPGVPAGAFAADPRASAPAVVKAAQKKLKLDEDAAVAYLQHLALSAPTTAAQQRWNAWDGVRLAAALAPLLKARLLLKAKRANSGREHFLPGGWETDSRLSTPIETWKLALYGIGRDRKGKLTDVRPTIPVEPLDELFARAWKRVEDGDAPRYEEVK